jgi:hypothetical protein
LSEVFEARPLLILAAAVHLAGGAAAADLDTAKLDEARSALGEAAAIARAEATGRVTHAYARGLREDVRKDLVKLRQEPTLKAVAAEALQALDANDEPALRALKDRLLAMERAHGRGR